jgi:hypothetical protein
LLSQRPAEVAAADDDVEILGAEPPEHLRQHRIVMLQVAVHHREIRRRRRQHTLDARGRQATPPDALEHADARIAEGDLPNRVRGAIGGVVVDEDDLPRDPAQNLVEPLHHQGHVVVLLEGGHDHRELERTDTAFRRAILHLDVHADSLGFAAATAAK